MSSDLDEIMYIYCLPYFEENFGLYVVPYVDSDLCEIGIAFKSDDYDICCQFIDDYDDSKVLYNRIMKD